MSIKNIINFINYNKKQAANDKEAAQAALPVAIAEISKAASKGIFHKNTAARKGISHNKGCKLLYNL